MTTLERYRGCLLGLAAGDALGTTLEFESPGSFTPITDIIGGGPFDLAPGEWTDDTSMALCLAESLVEKQGFDPVHQLETYVRWWRHGHFSVKGRCFDIGITTSRSLGRFEKTHEPYPGSTDPSAAGNGSLMRLAPAPLAFAHSALEAIDRAADSSRTTHAAPECVDSCRWFAALLVAAIAGKSKADVLAATVPELSPKVASVAEGSYRTKNPPRIRGSGYVVHTLEAALWAFHRTDSFRDGALAVVNLGEDADSTGAVYGQIAGVFYGESGIPAEWRAKLAMRETIESLAESIHALGKPS
jgi:ADP-ribosylglycohydrolase